MRDDHWQSEAAFFDQWAAERRGSIRPIDPLALRRYGAPTLRRRFAREFRLRLLGDLRGRRVIDVGCGEGTDTVLLALLGAERVVGIDLSPGAIEVARERARVNGVADRVELICAPVETAPIAPRSFDVVWCNAILHHLTDNLELVMRNMARWAKADGVLTFAEPINLNQPLRRLRQLIPVKREVTPDERPLEARDLEIVARHLEAMHARHFSLLGRLDQFILTRYNYERSSWWRRALVNVTAFVDWALLSLPWVDRLAAVGILWGAPYLPTLEAGDGRRAEALLPTAPPPQAEPATPLEIRRELVRRILAGEKSGSEKGPLH